ncbi:hypothetical protein OUZ56_008911 [Daphnia magna]|uniref:Uncharacterized protein n=1 Tax=Daphnia magna TaxID=35525 RepID=A0ABR0AEF2_9CRUS|nr:hypothetical protein OUZ56_008911 [Daphnia magna]
MTRFDCYTHIPMSPIFRFVIPSSMTLALVADVCRLSAGPFCRLAPILVAVYHPISATVDGDGTDDLPRAMEKGIRVAVGA